MSKLNRSDKIALFVLALALLAIIACVWISQPPQIADEFNPWRDSYAQWLMGILSVVATTFSVWAVKLLYDTLIETRRIGHAQTRAILAVNAAYIVGSDNGITVFIPIRNFGQTIAKKVIVTTHLRVGKIINGDREIDNNPSEKKHDFSIIEPNDAPLAAIKTSIKEEYLMTEQVGFSFDVRIDYEDIFGWRIVRKARYHFTMDELGRDRGRFAIAPGSAIEEMCKVDEARN